MGASPRLVMFSVIGRVAKLAAIGCLVGVALLFAGTRASSLLAWSGAGLDPAAAFAAALALVVVATGASVVPGIRGGVSDPAVVLRG
jgi:hypothetical protein